MFEELVKMFRKILNNTKTQICWDGEKIKMEKCPNCKAKIAGQSPVLDCPEKKALVQNYSCVKGCKFRVCVTKGKEGETVEIEWKQKKGKLCQKAQKRKKKL